MSANVGATEIVGDKRRTFFYLDIPIAPYLIAIVAGNLAEESLGTRTTVITEPEMMEAAKFEFEDLEKSLDEAEKLLGTYIWGKYSILVLPPNFPFGGMENPLLTFVSPSLLVGDKS